ncbi:hypothetical protein [Streptomyces sp. NPDC004042]|uniref:hypothetical protein n=1 Tax=Streptomyces sp. NPDC004042 TaxID=3154451 RepID=UPI0033B99BAF
MTRVLTIGHSTREFDDLVKQLRQFPQPFRVPRGVWVFPQRGKGPRIDETR